MAAVLIACSRVDSALGSWTVHAYEPPPGDPLADVLRRVWLFNGTTALPRECVFPNGMAEIVLQLDAAYWPVGAGGGNPFPRLSTAGIRTAAMTIEAAGGPVRVLGIELRPVGAFALLRAAMHELTDRDADLHAVIGRSAAELEERCADQRGDAACVAAALEWMRARVARAPQAAPAVLLAVEQIEANRGDLAIAELDALAGASRWRLAAAFRDQVGVTPKRLARIVRFKGALERLQTTADPLGAIAAAAGYYDQPHMNAEFRVHAGRTPQSIRLAQRYPDSSSLAEHALDDAATEREAAGALPEEPPLTARFASRAAVTD